MTDGQALTAATLRAAKAIRPLLPAAWPRADDLARRLAETAVAAVGQGPLPDDAACDHEYAVNVQLTHAWCQKCDLVIPLIAGGVRDHLGARAAAAERELLASLRERLENLAAGMQMSASATAPSEKSEIESGCAMAVLGIARSIPADLLDGDTDDK